MWRSSASSSKCDFFFSFFQGNGCFSVQQRIRTEKIGFPVTAEISLNLKIAGTILSGHHNITSDFKHKVAQLEARRLTVVSMSKLRGTSIKDSVPIEWPFLISV